MKLSEMQSFRAFNVLFKGEPGTGKTPAALSYPYPILYFDADFRASAVLPYFKHDKERIKNIEVVQPHHFDDVVVKLRGIQESFSKPEFKTIILDTLTTYADISIRSTVKDKGGSGGRKVGSVMIAGIQDYGDEAGVLSETITLMRLIFQTHKVNTILIAHVITSEEKDLNAKENKITYSRALLTGGKKIGAKVPAYYDEVYHTTVRPNFSGKPEFIALTRHTGFDFARTGLDCPNEIDFTNFERDPKKYFYNLIQGYIPSEEAYETNLKEEDKTERQVNIESTTNGF